MIDAKFLFQQRVVDATTLNPPDDVLEKQYKNQLLLNVFVGRDGILSSNIWFDQDLMQTNVHPFPSLQCLLKTPNNP